MKLRNRERSRWDWNVWPFPLALLALLMAMSWLVPMNPGPPPDWKPSVVHAAPSHSDFEVKTMPFWGYVPAVHASDHRNLRREIRILSHRVTANAERWVLDQTNIRDVLRVEKKWDLEITKTELLEASRAEYLVFTVTVYYLEEEEK